MYARLAAYHLEAAAEASATAIRAWSGYLATADPLTMATDGLRWWTTVLDRRPPRWHLPAEVRFRTPIAALRDVTAPADRAAATVPTLVLPPQAGHSSSIVDFSPEQSQLATLRGAGLVRLAALEWLPATAATRDATIDDYLAVVGRAVDDLGGRVNLVGDCQGGWLAAIYAALHPENVHTLTLAGAPLDFHAGDAVIAHSTRLLHDLYGMAPYRALVAAGGGTVPGAALLANFVGIAPAAEIGRQLELLQHLDEPDHVSRYRAFEDWFKHTQDLPGAFYLWLVEHLFVRNELIAGELVVGGRRVDPAAITCPLHLLAGARDHITPPSQVFAFADAVGTPAADIVRRTTAGGHLGLFMGHDALRTDWPALGAQIRARS
ncbi:alpha/beta fold hydrolase [Pseudonocardia sp. CA-107938]|uniref:alpha/beta fold hydrolase n=1 Tax=Pseudonocardia sp. CA-107938 TaxID=3240021 RepID=UPI003D8B98A0